MGAAEEVRLEPDVAAVLAERAIEPEPATLEEARVAYEADALRLAGASEPVAAVEDVDADGVPGRVYVPEDPEGVVVWLHGGGWSMGTLLAYDALCRALANRARAVVLSVDFRLAPEHRFPAALDDATRATEWALVRWGGAPVAVAGDSAGGNLAAVVARRLRGRVAFQLLVYPATDAAAVSASHERFGADGRFGLSRHDMVGCWECYAPGAAKRSPEVSPLRAPDLSGLAPAHVLLAECDPLTDEGSDYAGRLEAAGVPVEVRVWPGTVHGFLRWRGAVEVAETALTEAAGALRRGLDAAS